MDYVLDHIGSYQGHVFLTDHETARSACAATSIDTQSAILLQALQAGRLLSVDVLNKCIDDACSASITTRTSQTSRAKQTT